MSDKFSLPTIEELKKARVHIGHLKKYSHPIAKKLFVKSEISKFHIIDHTLTQSYMKDALNFCSKVVQAGGKILFVGSKKEQRDLISSYALECSMPYINKRWIGGLFTNFNKVHNSVRKLSQYRQDLADEEKLKSMTKKERVLLEREAQRVELTFGGISDMTQVPNAIFSLSASREHLAVTEAWRQAIPVISIVDTNSSPDKVNYPIPGNDDSLKAIKLYLETFANCIKQSQPSYTYNSSASITEEQETSTQE